jgi:MFS family permease
VLAPTLQYKVFNWSDQDYANINIAFKLAYAIGMLSMGAIIDRFGTRIGYTLSIAIWSLFGMLHAAVRPAFSVLGFSIARFGLGLGESGNFPAAIKTVGEWFPKKERAFATGIFNAGSNVGAILAPMIIPMVVWPDGTNWQYAFLTTGVFSAIWVVCWWKIYQRPEVHPRLSKAELAYINSDSVAETFTEKIPWSKVIFVRETWAFSLAKMTDAVWWFYLFWGGKFLFDKFGLSIKNLALPLITIYVIADVGSVVGGWMSSFFIKKGWTINRARKTTLFICACSILPVMFVTMIPTKFNANDRFYERLQTATYTVENIVTVDGKPKKEKVKLTVPAETQAALRALEGKSFTSAKDFTKEVAVFFGTPKIAPHLPALIEKAAGNFEVNDAFLDKIKDAFPADITKAIGSLKSKKFSSEKEFVAAVTEAVGRPDTNRMDMALISSARSDDYYWIAVLLIALAAAGHQAWSCNLFTLVSDVFPKKATASVTGIGGMFGAVAGLLADLSLGKVLTASGPAGYFFAFMIAGSCYLILLGVAHLLMPKMTPLDENLKPVKTA